jgi:hypothetical protein
MTFRFPVPPLRSHENVFWNAKRTDST